MKLSQASLKNRTGKVLIPEFSDQKLTSFAGIVIFQALFYHLSIKKRLSTCFKNSKETSSYKSSVIMLLLIVHIILGYRRLTDIKYYQDDPMVARILGLSRLPCASTVSRQLKKSHEEDVGAVRKYSEAIVIDRLIHERFARITLDFDGTVQSTSGHAEGSAVGFNKKKKGQRSYYPLLCMIAQTGQVLDVVHRSGNVHDSNGSVSLIKEKIKILKDSLGKVKIETRMDSAFFNEMMIEELINHRIDFTQSVPFARFTELKSLIENRKRWHRIDSTTSYFELNWKPNNWEEKHRFIFIRTKKKKQNKGPVQLDLFEPYEYGYEFKVIITNKTCCAKKVLKFHNGRGYQESIIAELKSNCHFDYIPVKKKTGNQLFMFAGIIAHNLHRELQMTTYKRDKNTTEKRKPLWTFKKLHTIRQHIIQRAGRLIRPNGKLTLTMSNNNSVQNELMTFLDAIPANYA